MAQDKMKWQLTGLPHNQIFATYPYLRVLYNEAVDLHADDISHRPLSPEQIMAFIVYTYHIRSPFVKDASMHKRRAQVLEHLGFQLGKDVSEEMAQLITMQNLFVNRLALHFCKNENNFKWIELIRKQEMLDDVWLVLKEETAGTEKKSAVEILSQKQKVDKQSKETVADIMQLSNELFAGDVDLVDYVSSQVIAEKRVALITPERVAAMSAADIKKQLQGE